MRSVQQLRTQLDVAKGVRRSVKDSLEVEKRRLTEAEKEADASSKAQVILQESARLTQEQLEYRISKLVTLAMESVFENPYEISLNFQSQRGKTGASIFFLRDDEPVDPLSEAEGGAVDVASLGLQISLWTLQNPRTRNLLVLDEPLKWLKGGELPEKGAEMIKQISHKLGLQILMVSHSPELISHADRVFQVKQTRRISTVTMRE